MPEHPSLNNAKAAMGQDLADSMVGAGIPRNGRTNDQMINAVVVEHQNLLDEWANRVRNEHRDNTVNPKPRAR